jgi:DNA-binding Xre family transcriptional regulator
MQVIFETKYKTYICQNKIHFNMTKLGIYFDKKSVNKAEVSRRTGISTTRISELTINDASHLRVEELYLIALAIDVKPCDLLKFVGGHLTLPKKPGHK